MFIGYEKKSRSELHDYNFIPGVIGDLFDTISQIKAAGGALHDNVTVTTDLDPTTKLDPDNPQVLGLGIMNYAEMAKQELQALRNVLDGSA